MAELGKQRIDFYEARVSKVHGTLAHLTVTPHRGRLSREPSPDSTTFSRLDLDEVVELSDDDLRMLARRHSVPQDVERRVAARIAAAREFKRRQ